MVQKEFNWIEQIRLGRKSAYSNLVVVHTDDPKRKTELLTHLTSKGLVSDKGEEVYLASTFNGVRHWNEQTDDWTKMEGRGGGINLLGSLQKVEPKMRKHTAGDNDTKPVILVIENYIEKLPMVDQTLIDFMADEALQQNWTTVIVVCPSMKVLGDEITKQALVVRPPISSEEERGRIIDDFLSVWNQGSDNSVTLDADTKRQIVSLTAGLNLNQVEAVIGQSIFAYGDLDLRFISDFKTREINKTGYLKVTQQPKFGFEGIGGYAIQKELLDETIIQPVRQRELAEALGIRYPKGVVTWGEPGTGKTVLSKALAKECGLPFFELAMSKVKSKFVGESEQNLAKALEIIRANSPCLVFIDEIDRLGGRTGSDADGGTSREIFSMLLQELGDEERNWILIGTTNEPEHCDPAFRRAGRIDEWIPVRYPGHDARKAIFNVHTAIKTKVPLADDVDVETIADQTNFYSGADVADLIEIAKRLALKDGGDEVTMAHFERALTIKIVPKEEREKAVQRYNDMTTRVCTDSRFMPQKAKSSGRNMSRAEQIIQG